jgi:hypothetical protein
MGRKIIDSCCFVPYGTTVTHLYFLSTHIWFQMEHFAILSLVDGSVVNARWQRCLYKTAELLQQHGEVSVHTSPCAARHLETA